MIPYGLIIVAYWTALLLFLAMTTALALISLARKTALSAILTALFLAASLGLAAIPFGSPPLLVSLAIGLLCIVISVVGGSPVAAWLLRAATRGSVRPGTHGGILITSDDQRVPSAQASFSSAADNEVMRGGLAIGLLERTAITVALMAGFTSAYALLVAIKGVGRFTELAAAEARERFIIGTLTSLLWATACAGVWLLTRM